MGRARTAHPVLSIRPEPGADEAVKDMDCDHAIGEVYAYLDGELTVWKRRAIARHLDKCPPCADGFHFEVELRQVIVSKSREEVPADLKARIARHLGIDDDSASGD